MKSHQPVRAWTNHKCLATKHHQTLFDDQTFYRLDTLFGAVWSCLYVFDRVWSCLIKFEGHQTFKQQLKTFLFYSCLMGDLFFVWTAAYQTCLKRACVPRLLSGYYQLFDLCLIKYVLIVWPLTSTLACLATKQCFMVFGRQTFIVCPGPKIRHQWKGFGVKMTLNVYLYRSCHRCQILFYFASLQLLKTKT